MKCRRRIWKAKWDSARSGLTKKNVDKILKNVVNWDADKTSEKRYEVWAMGKTIFLHFFNLKITSTAYLKY